MRRETEGLFAELAIGPAERVVRASAGLRRRDGGLLRLAPDVAQHPEMDAVDDRVRPELPVAGRPHVVAIPGRALEERASTGPGREPELAALRGQEPLEVGG